MLDGKYKSITRRNYRNIRGILSVQNECRAGKKEDQLDYFIENQPQMRLLRENINIKTLIGLQIWNWSLNNYEDETQLEGCERDRSNEW